VAAMDDPSPDSGPPSGSRGARRLLRDILVGGSLGLALEPVMNLSA
jgi:hypothetical protein